jgi:hypothetical protein
MPGSISVSRKSIASAFYRRSCILLMLPIISNFRMARLLTSDMRYAFLLVSFALVWSKWIDATSWIAFPCPTPLRSSWHNQSFESSASKSTVGVGETLFVRARPLKVECMRSMCFSIRLQSSQDLDRALPISKLWPCLAVERSYCIRQHSRQLRVAWRRTPWCSAADMYSLCYFAEHGNCAVTTKGSTPHRKKGWSFHT